MESQAALERQRQRQVDLHESEASFVYTANYKTAIAL